MRAPTRRRRLCLVLFLALLLVLSYVGRRSAALVLGTAPASSSATALRGRVRVGRPATTTCHGC